MGKKGNRNDAKKRAADKRNKRQGKIRQTAHMVDYAPITFPEGLSAARALAHMRGDPVTPIRQHLASAIKGDSESAMIDHIIPMSDHHIGAMTPGSKSDLVARMIKSAQDNGQTVAYIDSTTDANAEALAWIKDFNEAMSDLNIPGITVTASLVDMLATQPDLTVDIGLPRLANDRDVVMDDWLDRIDSDDEHINEIEAFGDELDRIGMEIDSEDDLFDDDFVDWDSDLEDDDDLDMSDFFEDDDLDLYYNEGNMGIWTGDGPIPTNGLEGDELPPRHYDDLDDHFFNERFDDDWDL